MSDHEVVNQWLDPQRVRTLAEGLLVPVPGSDFTPDESFFGDYFEGFTDQPSGPAEKKGIVQDQPPEPLVVPGQQRDPGDVPPSEERPAQSDPFRKVVAPPAGEAPRVESQIKPLPMAQSVEPASPEVAKKKTSEKSEVPSPFRPARQQASAPAPEKSQAAKNAMPAAGPKDDLQPFINWLKKQKPIHSAFICDQQGEVKFDEVGDAKLRRVGRSLGLAARPPERRGESDSAKSFSRVKIGPERFMEVLPLESPKGLMLIGLIAERPLSEQALEIVARTFHASFKRASPAGQ